MVVGIAYWLISPFFVDRVVSEEAPITENQNESFTVIRTGSFVGFDKVHYGSGTAQLLQQENNLVLRFEDDFDVANGPDLYVGFGKNGQYVKGSEIAPLKGNKGSQNYILSENFDLDAYNEVWIWCKAFSVGFAKVSLE